MTLLVLAALCLAAPVCAEDAPKLFENGTPVPLEDGLVERTGGSAWIRRRDVEQGLGVVVRALIPPLSDPFGRKRTRTPLDAFVLCQHGACMRVSPKDVDRAVPGNEAFRLEALAKGLGWTLRRRGADYDLVPKDLTPRRGFRLGDRVGALTLPDLSGVPRSIDALRGTRVLLVRFASWSPSRETLETWAATWKLRAARGLEIRVIALDVEGAAHVKTYVPPALRERAWIDRDGLTARLGGALEDGRFLLLDELGVVRAIGGEPTTDNVGWVDRHLDEPLVDTSPTTAAGPPEPATDADLRARLAQRPGDASARITLAGRLAARGDVDEALALLDARAADTALAWLRTRLRLDRGDRAGALDVLDAARRERPKDLQLRTQRWALLHPERFYTADIDRAWLRKTLKAEDEELGRTRRRR